MRNSISSLLLTLVMLLQSVASAAGTHQLHVSDHQTESETHPHIQVDIDSCSTDHFVIHDIVDAEHEDSAHHEHSQLIDLCLDCQCHSGHGAIIAQSYASLAMQHDVILSFALPNYFPPESSPAYRPPIV